MFKLKCTCHEFSLRKRKIPGIWASPSPSQPLDLYGHCVRRGLKCWTNLRFSPSSVTECSLWLIMQSGSFCQVAFKHLSSPLSLLRLSSFIFLSGSETGKTLYSPAYPSPLTFRNTTLTPFSWKGIRKGDCTLVTFFLLLIFSSFPDVFYLRLISALDKS